METICSYCAWRITPPQPYGIFHIGLLFLAMPIVIFCAYRSRLLKAKQQTALLFALGVLLIVMEVYKQLFTFYIVNHHHYLWWIFPFQLCSLPMYLCVCLPFLPHQGQWRTFLMDISLLGGSMALLFPEGMMSSYLILTLHSFLWHLLLLFIGFHLAFTMKSSSPLLSCFIRFIFCAGIATIGNLCFHHYGEINLFYINPYEPFAQPVFASLEPILGRGAVIFLYLCACLLGLAIMQRIASVLLFLCKRKDDIGHLRFR